MSKEDRLPEGFMLVRKEWMPIISEIDRRAEKMDGRNEDFTVTITAEEYRAADDADRAVTVESVAMLSASQSATTEADQ